MNLDSLRSSVVDFDKLYSQLSESSKSAVTMMELNEEILELRYKLSEQIRELKLNDENVKAYHEALAKQREHEQRVEIINYVNSEHENNARGRYNIVRTKFFTTILIYLTMVGGALSVGLSKLVETQTLINLPTEFDYRIFLGLVALASIPLISYFIKTKRLEKLDSSIERMNARMQKKSPSGAKLPNERLQSILKSIHDLNNPNETA